MRAPQSQATFARRAKWLPVHTVTYRCCHNATNLPWPYNFRVRTIPSSGAVSDSFPLATSHLRLPGLRSPARANLPTPRMPSRGFPGRGFEAAAVSLPQGSTAARSALSTELGSRVRTGRSSAGRCPPAAALPAAALALLSRVSPGSFPTASRSSPQIQ